MRALDAPTADVRRPGLRPGFVCAAIGARLRRAWPLKVAVAVGGPLPLVVFFAIQSLQGPPSHAVPETFLDRAIPFDPGWVYAYLSFFVLTGVVPWLLPSAGDLLRYVRGYVALCVACYVVFLLFPVRGPRPLGVAGHDVYAWVVRIDGPGNSMPSLHAGVTVYALWAGRRMLGGGAGAAARRAYAAIAFAWGGAILYATVATRQHWALDLPPAVLLALASERWAFHPPSGTSPASRRGSSRSGRPRSR